jgi:hypothetical protein
VDSSLDAGRPADGEAVPGDACERTQLRVTVKPHGGIGFRVEFALPWYPDRGFRGTGRTVTQAFSNLGVAWWSYN